MLGLPPVTSSFSAAHDDSTGQAASLGRPKYTNGYRPANAARTLSSSQRAAAEIWDTAFQKQIGNDQKTKIS
jgi:hypothetical protein